MGTALRFDSILSRNFSAYVKNEPTLSGRHFAHISGPMAARTENRALRRAARHRPGLQRSRFVGFGPKRMPNMDVVSNSRVIANSAATQTPGTLQAIAPLSASRFIQPKLEVLTTEQEVAPPPRTKLHLDTPEVTEPPAANENAVKRAKLTLVSSQPKPEAVPKKRKKLSLKTDSTQAPRPARKKKQTVRDFSSFSRRGKQPARPAKPTITTAPRPTLERAKAKPADPASLLRAELRAEMNQVTTPQDAVPKVTAVRSGFSATQNRAKKPASSLAALAAQVEAEERARQNRVMPSIAELGRQAEARARAEEKKPARFAHFDLAAAAQRELSRVQTMMAQDTAAGVLRLQSRQPARGGLMRTASRAFARLHRSAPTPTPTQSRKRRRSMSLAI